jgi:hypothetical protein
MITHSKIYSGRLFISAGIGDIERATIRQLLVFLGVPRSLVYYPPNCRRRRGWWDHNAPRLHEFLALAKAAYKRRIAEAHPDRNPAAAETAVQLNLAMQKTETLFARRGISF